MQAVHTPALEKKPAAQVEQSTDPVEFEQVTQLAWKVEQARQEGGVVEGLRKRGLLQMQLVPVLVKVEDTH